MLRHVVRTVITGLTGYMRTGTGKELGLKYDFIYVYRLGYFYTTLVKEVKKCTSRFATFITSHIITLEPLNGCSQNLVTESLTYVW
jgi:hypothetical protein